MPITVTNTQSTPNPNALKYILDGPISRQPVSFFNAEAAKDHSMARSFFEISGVTSVLLLGDFLTINKAPEARWEMITKGVKRALQSAEPAE